MVLRGAVSQRKRSPAESFPIGPASAPPSQIRAKASRCSRISSIFVSRHNAWRRVSLSSKSARKNFLSPEYSMIPTLINSCRSTHGTSRITAYSNNCFSDTLRLLYKDIRRRKPILQELCINFPLFPRGYLRLGKPLIRNEIHYRLDYVIRQHIPCFAIRLLEASREREQNVVRDLSKSPAALLVPIVPRVMKKQRCAVVDQPQLSVPHQKICVTRRTVDIRHKTIKPVDRGGCLFVD